MNILVRIKRAVAIYKSLRSTSPRRSAPRERLHVIVSPNLGGVPIYTKGKLASEAGVETYYFLVSSKMAR